MSSEGSPRRPDDERIVAREEAAAAREAAAIGGWGGEAYDVGEAERPLAEAGQGYAEGFELAEHDLIAAASHSAHAPDPTKMAGLAERFDPGAVFGEADDERIADDRPERG